MTFKIKDIFLEVVCEVEEFEELVYGRFSQFTRSGLKGNANYIKIYKDKIEININNQVKEIKGKILKTDLYTIINNVISYIINDKENLYLHSVVVSNNNKGILIIGNFGQGKTTLANEFQKYGFTINSTDQTWIEIKDGELRQKVGSRFYIENNEIKYINMDASNKNVKIEKIIRIVALCNNGDIWIEEPKTLYTKARRISDYANWSMISPIFTDDIEMYKINVNITDFLLQLEKIPLYEVRGDKEEIVKLYI